MRELTKFYESEEGKDEGNYEPDVEFLITQYYALWRGENLFGEEL